MKPRSRKYLKRGLFGLIASWLIATVVLLGFAYHDATKGRQALLAAQKATTTETLRTGATDPQLQRASTLLSRAHRELSNPVVAPWRLFPVLGRQLSSVTALTGAGATVADTGVDALGQIRQLDALDKSDRQLLLTRIATVSNDANAQLNDVDLGPDHALFGPLGNARADIDEELTKLRDALGRAGAASSASAHLLSTNGRYLVVAANNGEMRAGSGMFLSVGELKTGDGQFELSKMQTVGDVAAPTGSVTWPEELNALWGWLGKQNDFRNLMVSPRFDVAAPIAEQVWEKSGHDPVDGVLLVDPALLQAVLNATGPVDVDGKTFNASNVLQQLLLDQYQGLDGSREAQANRRESLSGVASATFSALNSGSWNAIALARNLSDAAAGRHVMLFANDPVVQAQWKAAGVTGELTSDSLAFNLINTGGNKLDQFVHVDSALTLTTGQSGLDASVAVTMTNRAPSSAAGYVLGPFPGSGLQVGEYQGLFTLNLPADVEGVAIEGNHPWAVAGHDGPTQTYATQIQIKRGETKTIVVHFTRRATAQKTVIEPSARIPQVEWHFRDDAWSDNRAHTVEH